MSEDPFGYIDYSNKTGSGDSGGGCSPGCLGWIGIALIVFLSILGSCSH